MNAAAAALAMLSASCGGGGGGGGGTASGTVTGTATYERVPATANGLNYAAAQPRPIRGAIVRVVDPSNNGTVAQSVTDDAGNFSIAYSRAPAQVAVAVLAQTQSPPLTVKDNTGGGATWGIASAPFVAEGAHTVDVRAASGWTGAAYDPAARAAGPFAILDSMLTAARAFLAVRPNITFPALGLNWSPENVPELTPAGGVDYPNGLIGTSHWNGQELFILGAENQDTDEFDDHVIVHEWAHYYEATLSRSDSPGGRHGPGELKDPRLAWGEGWGNGLSAIALADPLYRDTLGPGQGTTGIEDDFEANAAGTSRDPFPGWWSEASIARLLVDLADSANEATDTAAFGLGAIHDAMTAFQKNTPALTTVFSFVSGLKRVTGVNAAQVDQVVAARGVLATSIAADASGEFAPAVLRQNPATTAGAAIYEQPVSGTATLAGDDFNDLDQNRFYVIQGTGATRSVTVSNNPDVDIHVYSNGQVIRRAEALAPPSGPQTETVSFPAAAGQTYVVVVTGFSGTGPTPYPINVTFQ